MAQRQIFISHITAEGELAEHLKKRLTGDFLGMVDVFVSSDRESIGAGTRWLDALEQALHDAALFVVLCSPQSIGRPWVNFEAGAAWLQKVPLVPLCHSGMTPGELPAPFNALQVIEGGQPRGLRKLYDGVAGVLGVNTPSIDFDALAAEVRRLEEKYRASVLTKETIERPRILCAASEQYAQIGFEQDVAVLQWAFGVESVVVETALTGRRLRELLSERFDIVHLVLAVDPETGALLFSPIDTETRAPAGTDVDRMPATAFASLLEESQTRLLVLATCKALLLAVFVSNVANMAAPDVDITAVQAAEWGEYFYGLLAQGKSVHRALELTTAQLEHIPVRRILHMRDVSFKVSRPSDASPIVAPTTQRDTKGTRLPR